MDEIKYEGSLSELHDQLLDEEENNVKSQIIKDTNKDELGGDGI